MNDDRQLPLIKEFMLRVGPEVVRHRYNLIRESESPYAVGFDPSQIAEITLGLAMHLAAAYARCYDQFNEKDSLAARQQAPPEPAENLHPAPPGLSP